MVHGTDVPRTNLTTCPVQQLQIIAQSHRKTALAGRSPSRLLCTRGLTFGLQRNWRQRARSFALVNRWLKTLTLATVRSTAFAFTKGLQPDRAGDAAESRQFDQNRFDFFENGS